jgi:uncharacterized protein YrrD
VAEPAVRLTREGAVKSKNVKGLAVINVTDGAKVGEVERVFLDPKKKQVVGFVIDPGGGLLSPEASLLADTVEVHSLGSGALTLDSAAPRGGDTSARYGDLIDLATLHGRQVFTADGSYLGTIGSASFDERSFAMSTIEVSGGLFESTKEIPVSQIMTIGPEVVVVAAEAAGSGVPTS